MYIYFQTITMFVLAVVIGVIVTVYYLCKATKVIFFATVYALTLMLSISLSKRY